ncbi:MAG: class I SAM-dependent methyltransferase [Leptospiraceae bacterium]|nr:class I SAM-dependent methyltransferase [Leptospiraceae bacterium]MCP5501287.1 class I SAM-dependent methyltransferase [Leptospiraceae bacterium]
MNRDLLLSHEELNRYLNNFNYSGFYELANSYHYKDCNYNIFDFKNTVKYFDLFRYFSINLQYFKYLNLHRETNKNVLDLGSGFGYLGFLCQYHNHAYTGIDLDIEIYNDMFKFFNLEKKICNIQPDEVIALDKKYDYVISVMIQYAKKWTEDNWFNFLNNLKPYLNQDAKMFFRFIRKNLSQPFFLDFLKALERNTADYDYQREEFLIVVRKLN